MNSRNIEIVKLDPIRWAVLHLPVAVLLPVWFLVYFYIQESHVDANDVFHGIVFAVIGIPVIALIVLFVAWLQAVLLNLFFKLMGKGPILEVAEHDPAGNIIR